MSTAGNRKNTIAACALLAVLILSKVLLRPFGGLDELWVYNLSRGIVMGYVPYKDFTMAMMPLFNILFALPLYIVKNLFVYRICSALMLFELVFVYYRIASKITGHLWGLLASLFLVVFMDFATYNGLMVLLVFIIFLLFGRLNTRNAVITGVLSGLTVLCRQTSGVFLLIAVLILMCTDKTIRKYIIPFLAGWGTVMVIFAAYLFATGSFSAFWDCCFFALVGSGEKNSGFFPDGIVVDLLTVIGVISSVYLVKKNSDKNDVLHLVFGIILISIGIPTVDMMHMYYAMAWFMIPLFKLMKDSVSESPLKIIIAMMSAVILFLNVYDLPKTTLDNRYKEFFLIPVDSSDLDYYEHLVAVNDKYESKGYRIVMLSSGRCIFSMMTDSFDPVYDLFLVGNKGTRTALSFIEEEMNNGQVMFVINGNYEKENWENPSGILSYIQDNCDPVEVYGEFIWYVPRVSSSAEA